MPTSEQTITTLNNDLNDLAAQIETTGNNLADTLAAIEEADQHLSNIKAGHLADILTARFETNLKLQFTNDDQRKAEITTRLNNDSTYQRFTNARQQLIKTQSTQRAEIEKNRYLHQAKLLVLRYYAGLP